MQPWPMLWTPMAEAEELGLGPDVGVHLDALGRALGVEGGDGRVMTHLLGEEAELGLVCVGKRSVISSRASGLGQLSPVELALEGLAEDGIVGFLGDLGASSGVEGGEIPASDGDHAILGGVQVGDGEEEVGVSEEVGVHLEETAPLQDEGGQSDLGQVHADGDLAEEMHDDGSVLLDVAQFLVVRIVVDGVEVQMSVCELRLVAPFRRFSLPASSR